MSTQSAHMEMTRLVTELSYIRRELSSVNRNLSSIANALTALRNTPKTMEPQNDPGIESQQDWPFLTHGECTMSESPKITS